ncbi:MAG: 50S ribosomal protein L30 [Candidatus Bathyarchaeia archaeon]
MYAVIRIRGSVNVREEVEDTLHRLHLDKPNNCVLLPETESYLGMLREVKDLVAYGRVDTATVAFLLRKRARLQGGRRLTDEALKQIGYSSVEELAAALTDGKVLLRDVPKLIPVLRLRPPSGGHKSVKRQYPEGSLGDWGPSIAQLLTRMA